MISVSSFFGPVVIALDDFQGKSLLSPHISLQSLFPSGASCLFPPLLVSYLCTFFTATSSEDKDGAPSFLWSLQHEQWHLLSICKFYSLYNHLSLFLFPPPHSLVFSLSLSLCFSLLPSFPVSYWKH